MIGLRDDDPPEGDDEDGERRMEAALATYLRRRHKSLDKMRRRTVERQAFVAAGGKVVSRGARGYHPKGCICHTCLWGDEDYSYTRPVATGP